MKVLVATLVSFFLCQYAQAELYGERESNLLINEKLFKSSFGEDINEEEKIAGLSLLWAEIKYNFVAMERITVQRWDQIFSEYLTKVSKSGSTLEYYLLLQEMVAQLKDSHTVVHPPEPLLAQIYARPQIETRRIEGKVIITDVWSEELLRDGVETGLEITAIDGLATREYAERYIAPYQSSSTVQDLVTRTYEYALLSGSREKPIELELKNDRGRTYKKVVPRVFPYHQQRSRLTFTQLEGNVAYVALNTFATKDIVEEFAAIFPDVLSTDALIIDIRENVGGSSEIGYEIFGYLVDRPFKVSNWKTRQYVPAFRAWGKPETWYVSEKNERRPKTVGVYKKPVVVLTSARTISAAEDFCVAFDYAGRGIIVGQKTAGSTGQPVMIALPGGGTARIRAKHDTYPNGKEFIDVGIAPDIMAYPTVEDVRANRDAVLAKAMDYLKDELKWGFLRIP